MDSNEELEAECRLYDEFAGQHETVAREYRRVARLLRLAGAVLPASDVENLRSELAGIVRRVIATSTISVVLTGDPRNVKEE